MRNIEIFEAYADCSADDHGCIDAVITVVLREVSNGSCFYKSLHISTIKLLFAELEDAYISEDASWIDEEFAEAYSLIKDAINRVIKEEFCGLCLEFFDNQKLELDLSGMSQDLLERMM